ncbi:MAG TPA: aconitate hydratase [Polyangiaceae bacterium]|jgi:aconitate hydratase
MGKNVTQKLIAEHLVAGRMAQGEEIGIRIDQTLTQDATGTLVMLELEAMGLDRVKTEVSAQYVDHNLIQEDHKNADDHLFLESACRRFGIWYSRPGNGVSHPVHQERFGVPGKTLLGSDSHTPAAGSIGMLAVGAGGLEVALAMAGEPFYFAMPAVWGVELSGRLSPWVSAKDVILEMLRRHGVDGGLDRIVEYYGPGLETLTAMDRHVIANMGAELGATTTVFPSDTAVRRFLRAQGREHVFVPLEADDDADYDVHEEIDLSAVEPLIAMPSSPGNVVPVREVAGKEIYQAYIGSSANPGYRDFAMASKIVEGRRVHPRVSFDVNPTSRQILENLVRDGLVAPLLHAGARLHQAGCNGCIGMGQAPATDRISLRTVPRNFPGRSGTKEDKVCLVSPETAAASALTGVITDPRSLGIEYPIVGEPEAPRLNLEMLQPPPSATEARGVALVKGPNITSIPPLHAPHDDQVLPVLLKLGDDVSTDEILPAGLRVLPFRSNLQAISRFCFERVDPTYSERAVAARGGAAQRGPRGEHAIVAGRNYGQGSSREHAALAPAYLGLRVVLALSFGRIHMQNLANFGVLPLVMESRAEYEQIRAGDRIRIHALSGSLKRGRAPLVEDATNGHALRVRCELSARQVDMLLAGGLFNWMKRKFSGAPSVLAAG